MPDEARMTETDGGLEPARAGWFVVNVRDAAWWRHDTFGARKDPESLLYPVDEVARKHGAGVDEETPDPRQAYASFPKARREPLEDAGLPWQ